MILHCRECNKSQEIAIPSDVIPPKNFLCRECARDRSMVDQVEDIGRTRLARQVLWQREARLVEYVNGTSAWTDGYKVYVRKKDRMSKFRRRNGYTQQAWYRRVDQLGWRCSECGREVTKMTVVAWSVDGTKKLESQIPLCRPCQCKRVGSVKGRPLSDHYTSEGEESCVAPGSPESI